jgi:hypothetical protein
MQNRKNENGFWVNGEYFKDQDAFWQSMRGRMEETNRLLKKAAELHKVCDFRELYGIWLNEPIDCCNELANNVIIERSQKETINANDVKYSVRFGKRYKYNSYKIGIETDYRMLSWPRTKYSFPQWN